MSRRLSLIYRRGVNILLALIAGIFQVIPQLIVAAVKLIITLVGEIIKNLPKLLEAGVKLIEALIKGILSLLGQLGNDANRSSEHDHDENDKFKGE